MVRLFDIENGKVLPTEHCLTLRDLAMVKDCYPEDYHNVYAYLFYMTCPNPDDNPFFDVREDEKEELILSQLAVTFSTEDAVILSALVLCKKLYETPTLRAYLGIKAMVDRMGDYMGNTEVTHGRDGNINSAVNLATKFEQIRISFKGVYKDLMEEQKSQVRGGSNVAYDQQK